MSFIVSYNGQFKPFSITENLSKSKIGRVLKTDHTNEINDAPEAFSMLTPDQESTKQHNKVVTSTYLKSEKKLKRTVTPNHARDIMSHQIKFLTEDSTYQDAVKLMNKYKVRHLPVLENGNLLIGMVSEKDLLKNTHKTSAIEVMTNEVLSCFENATVQDISRIMLEQKVSALPIVNLDYQLIGIVTKSDILKYVTNIISVNGLF
jgi:CBS domain-containing protein